MSVKTLDREGRWRDRTVSFRVSDEENERIDQLAAMSGKTKQDFIVSRLEGKEITVVATARVQKSLAVQARRVANELERLAGGDEVRKRLANLSEALLGVLEQMADAGMKIDEEPDGTTLEEMETSELAATMTPEMRQVPLVPDEVEPIADADARKPKRRRQCTKGMFKREKP